MNDVYKIFKQIIRESNYDNTYKMAWAKALVELSTELDLSSESIQINLSDIAAKYLKYYWNQTIFFDLRQGSNPIKNPVIVSYTKDLINDYYMNFNTNMPILFEKLDFDNVKIRKSYEKTINNISKALKYDVSWRFVNLNGIVYNQIYEYEKGGDKLIIKSSLLNMLKDNELDLYDLINYRWGLILETFNSSPRINKKVKIMDEREIKRSSLSKFKKYLDLENHNHKCFICNNEIEENNMSIDHVIPWSYLYSDDIWNLVYVCKNCNSTKNNRIPNIKEINKLKERNDKLLSLMDKEQIKNKDYEELKLAIEKDYVNKFWIGSKN